MDSLYKNLYDLVAIPSITRTKEEIEIVIYIKELLESILKQNTNNSWITINIEKVEEKDENWNFHWWIICNIKVSDNFDTIWLLWHLDIVPVNKSKWKKPIFKMTEEDDRIYGRGSCDMKAWVAIMIEILKESLRKNPNKNISLIFTSWEECWIPNWLTEIIKSEKIWWLDFIIALEPTWWKINTWVFWYLDWEFTFKWKSCHSSRPSLWNNAIHKTCNLLNYLQNPKIISLVEYYWEFIEEALSATYISWWIAPNIIPDTCTVRINHRYWPKRNWKLVEEWFQKIMKEVWAESFKILEHDPASWIVDWNNYMLKDFINRTKLNSSTLNVVSFWSDISQTSSIGIPSINFWPWDISQAHTDDEFLMKDSFEKTYVQFINYLFD